MSTTAVQSKPKRATHPPEIKEAVKLAVAARGTTNGAPGPKQHLLVREALRPAVGDPKAIIKAAGVKSEKALREIANGTAARDELKALHPLAKRIDEQFCRGRWLAAMLVAALDQAKSQPK